MSQTWMRHPVHAGDLLCIELDFLMKRTAQGMQHAAFNRALECFRIDHQSAVMRANHPLHPDVSGLAVHFNFRNLRNDGLTAVGVRNSATRENLSSSRRTWRRSGVPTESVGSSLDASDGPSPAKRIVVGL